MTSSTAPRLLRRVLASTPRPVTETSLRATSRWTRQLSTRSRLPTITIASGARPQAYVTTRQTVAPSLAGVGSGIRTIFIQTENTPNPDALKFVPNHRVIPEGIATPFIEYLNPRATIAPPYPSPLAAKLMNIDGITSVFFGADFITVSKAADVNWAHVRPEIFALITETITSGDPIVNLVERKEGDAPEEEDSLAYNENDSEVVGMIKELLETRIRPAIQEDGGDIDFRGFDDDGFVHLRLRGACRTCDSSTVTLKNGIEGMLMHYIEEVKGVKQVLDPEEEISLQEFEKFEEKLKQQKNAAANA
ncbi:scaffold protein Nfu/NifU N terminal-domain-containing protein [Mariannaea sp. PMI_226]|nr:scaffold protein Nfu/NifU N terminal-domain-containing protein [Mariannaea sp. PMI_226]